MHTHSVLVFCGTKRLLCFAMLGSGSLPEALVALVKAQLLAWLLYTTKPLLQHQLQGAGQAPEQAQEGQEEDQESELRQKLPGPCPVLRCLITFDAGKASLPTVSIWLNCMHSSPAGLVHVWSQGAATVFASCQATSPAVDCYCVHKQFLVVHIRTVS